MRKPFCDICEEPCEDKYVDISLDVPYGDFYNRPCDSSLGYEVVQSRIIASVTFRFWKHRTGFGGPPDLCLKCRIEILQMLLNKEEDFLLLQKGKTNKNDRNDNCT
jgi:hypothetical protein